MFRLGVSRKLIHHIDARNSGDSVKKEVLVQKWLDSDSGASWDKLVSAIAEMMGLGHNYTSLFLYYSEGSGVWNAQCGKNRVY